MHVLCPTGYKMSHLHAVCLVIAVCIVYSSVRVR